MAHRRPNVDWELPATGAVAIEQAELAVLMDIRAELRRLTALLGCENFIAVPRLLRTISRNTAKPKKRVKRRG